MPEVMSATLQEAVGLLLGVCDGAHAQDGQGFNGWDSAFARDLWPKREHWTPGQVFAVWKMLQKYRAQLAGLGFDLMALEAPPDPKATKAPGQGAVQITMGSAGVLVITFPFDEVLRELVRQIPGRSWDKEGKRWLVPSTPENFVAVQRFAEQTGAAMPEGLVEAVEAGRRELERAALKAAENTKDSMATDADFHVDGLGGVLMGFQRAGVKYASEKRRVLIADEPGLGKTVQALATVRHLNTFPALVVCPATLRLNWIRETVKWLPGKAAALYEKNPYADLCIINYDVLTKYHAHIVEKARFKSVIFDEAHYLKNHKAQRSVAAREIAKLIRLNHKEQAVILALTGTPILNRPGELLHLLTILHRLEDVGGYKKFTARYLGWDFKGEGQHLEELQTICRSTFLIRREKSQVLTELPAKRRIVVDTAMEDPKAYAKLAARPLEDSEAAALVRIGELRREAARQKLKAVHAWVTDFMETGKKLILFASHKEAQASLVQAFPGCAQILGDDSGKARQDAVDRFQEDPACRLIVCSLKAAGVGITLTAASDVAFVELGWTPGDMDQAEDRAHRIGQRDSVTAWYLLAEGENIDREMFALIQSKRAVSERLLDGKKAITVTDSDMKASLVRAILSRAQKAGTLKKASA